MFQVADFGLARSVVNSKYNVSNNELLAKKWTAPEAIFHSEGNLRIIILQYKCMVFKESLSRRWLCKRLTFGVSAFFCGRSTQTEQWVLWSTRSDRENIITNMNIV